eukprot:7255126-Prymnesium_polylepis.1
MPRETWPRGAVHTNISAGATGGGTDSVACLWPMADDVARGRCRALRAPCGASGARYVSTRGRI